jgi:hypothetical protein
LALELPGSGSRVRFPGGVPGLMPVPGLVPRVGAQAGAGRVPRVRRRSLGGGGFVHVVLVLPQMCAGRQVPLSAWH